MKQSTLAVAVVVAALAACGGQAPPAAQPGSETTAAPTPEPASGATAGPASRTPATTFELDGMKLILPGPIGFATGTAELTADAEASLWLIADYLAAKSYVTTVRIEGHVQGGAADDALTLSAARAVAVAAWLVAHGVDCSRLLPVAFGDHKPAFGDARDTRIEVVNAALRGRPIGGMPPEGVGQVAGDACAP